MICSERLIKIALYSQFFVQCNTIGVSGAASDEDENCAMTGASLFPDIFLVDNK